MAAIPWNQIVMTRNMNGVLSRAVTHGFPLRCPTLSTAGCTLCESDELSIYLAQWTTSRCQYDYLHGRGGGGGLCRTSTHHTSPSEGQCASRLSFHYAYRHCTQKGQEKPLLNNGYACSVVQSISVMYLLSQTHNKTASGPPRPMSLSLPQSHRQRMQARKLATG